MEAKDQLLEMLKTIEEAEAFLRRRCASGMAGQSLQLFEDLSSLIELIQNSFLKTEYLPAHTPYFIEQADTLSALAFLDRVEDWTRAVHKRVERKKVRQELARGSSFEALSTQGKPFADTARALVELAQANPQSAPEEPPAAPLKVPAAPDQNQPEAPVTREKSPVPAAPSTLSPPETSPENGRLTPAAESAKLMAALHARGSSASSDRAREQAPPQTPSPAQTAESKPPQPEVAAKKPVEAAENTQAEQIERREPARKSGARPMGSARPMGASKQTEAAKQTGRGGSTDTDRAFYQMMEEIAGLNEKQLAGKMISGFPKLENRYKMVIIDYFRRFPYWGRLDPDNDVYGVFSSRAAQLVQRREDFVWLYSRLGDYRSRKTLLAILDNWYSFNFKELTNVKERIFMPYFDYDLIHCTEHEVFVDLGAYVGETAHAFVNCFGDYQKIICYEISEENFGVLTEKTADLPRIELRRKGVSDHAGSACIAQGQEPSTCHLAESGGPEIETVTLDGDLRETVSMIKMNLEGGEQEALQGCGEHIHRDHPKLIIRLDHKNEDLWKIPRMVDRLGPDYRLFLRHYGGNLVPAEYVLIAI